MSVSNIVPQGDPTAEYHNVLRGLVSENYQHLSGEELEAAVEEALDQLPEEEAEEIFGLLAGIATSAASGIIKKAGKKLIGRVFRRGGRRVLSRFGRIARRTGRRVINRVSRRFRGRNPMLYLMRMVRNPQFLTALAGSHLNRRTGGRIAKSVVRTVVKRRGRTETVEVSLESYLNAISYLAAQSGQDGNVGREAAFLNGGDVNASEAENVLAELFGEESQDYDGHGQESWGGESTVEGDYYDGYESDDANGYADEAYADEGNEAVAYVA